ncbi:MAG: hypothetical protein JRK53_19895 [Deltaproteobacteria bacterium]|nr:hypothetical protein [Deltaproteobacteria bacterium]
MNTEVSKRRLTAILNADEEGYSRLMRDDEDETIRTITAYRNRAVCSFRSNIVYHAGVLFQFP